MAEICLGLTTSHVAFITQAPELGDPAQVERFRDGYRRLSSALAAAGADAALLISGEHVNKFFLDNMPAFSIGLMDEASGPVEKGAGIPHRTIPCCRSLADHLLRRGLDEGVDWAVSENWVFDHGMAVPLYLLDPQGQVPIVPIHVNCSAPPLPSARRCYAVGQWLASAVQRWQGGQRVAIIATGGLSHSVGTEQMGWIDVEFDRRFLQHFCSGRAAGVADLTDTEIEAAGNSTAEIRSWIMLAGACAGRPVELLMYEPIAGFATGCAQCLIA